MRAIFFQGFTSRDRDYKASDAVGYGITSAEALMEALPHHGVEVSPVVPPIDEGLADIERRRLSWIIGGYEALLRLELDKYDLIFIFHAFQQFPAEMRRILFDLKVDLPIVGYSQGSHWDPTDTFRFIHYPGMEPLDAANLLCMDRVLIASEYMREVMLGNLHKWQPDVARAVEEKLAVVGLPINTGMMDAHRCDEKSERLTIVFNHSLIPSKDPELFAHAAEKILEMHDVQFIVTREAPGPQFRGVFDSLERRFPGHFVFGGTLSLAEYFRTLWKADIQLSTAWHATLGVSPLEAMYAENCCLMPDRCSYPEITGGFSDILYASPEDLVEKLDFFIRHEDRRREVAEELHRRSLRYAPDEVAGNITSVLAGVVKTK